MRNRTITRRTFLRTSAGAGVGAAAIGLVGCGDDDDDDDEATATAAAGAATATAAAAAQPKRGGKLTYVPSLPIPHLDIHTSSFFGAGLFSPFIYSTLLRLKVPENLPEPQAAQAMPEQPDPTTMIFKLRPNVAFHDKPPVSGRLATAEDVVYSLERVRTKDPTFINAPHLITVDKVEAVDKLTVKITTKQPDAAMLTIMALYPFSIIAKESVEKFGDLKPGESAIGTGPFQLKEFTANTSIAYERHPKYFTEGLPYLDEINGVLTPDPWSRLLSGGIDTTTVPSTEFKDIATRHPELKVHSAGNHGTARGWMLNTTRAFKDVRVRRAMALLIDQREYRTFESSGAKNWRESISLGETHKFWNLSAEETGKFQYYVMDQAEKNAAEAIKLLEAAGFTKDNPLKIDNVLVRGTGTPTADDTGDFHKTMVERASKGAVKMELRLVDYGTLIPIWAQSQFDTSNSGWVNGPDPEQAIAVNQRTGGGRNYGKYSDPELDALIDKQRQTFDIEARKKIIHDILRRIADEVPYVWLGYTEGLVAVRKDVNGLKDTGIQDRWLYERVWLS